MRKSHHMLNIGIFLHDSFLPCEAYGGSRSPRRERQAKHEELFPNSLKPRVNCQRGPGMTVLLKPIEPLMVHLLNETFGL